MRTEDHALIQEWLDLELEGELSSDEAERLAGHLAACAECRAERQALQRLQGLLRESRLPVRQGFRDEVLARLPVAGWEARSPRAWRLPLAVLALLGAASAGLLGASSGQLAGEGTMVGALAAVAGLFATALMAGAGLLSASWKGVGLVVERVITASSGGLFAFAVLVVCLHLLLFSLLRRRRRLAVEETPPTDAES